LNDLDSRVIALVQQLLKGRDDAAALESLQDFKFTANDALQRIIEVFHENSFRHARVVIGEIQFSLSTRMASIAASLVSSKS